jgi:hypothetical protein
MERQLDERVRGFVDDALGSAVALTVSRISSPSFAPDLARWRIDVLHALFTAPLDRLLLVQPPVEAERLAEDVAAVLRSLAEWRQLSESLEAVLARILSIGGSGTARAFLDQSGLEEAWRPTLEEALVREANALVATPEFEAWLARTMELKGARGGPKSRARRAPQP